MADLTSLGVSLNPAVYPQPGQIGRDREVDEGREPCSAGGGFMTGLLSTINRTWPNPHHVYLNLGKGGSNLELLVEATCLDAYIPEEVRGRECEFSIHLSPHLTTSDQHLWIKSLNL